MGSTTRADNRRYGLRVVLTGASSGLGAACALILADQGARLALVARRAGRLQTIARGVRERGGEPLVLRADLTRPADISGLSRVVQRRFGGCDVLINNAGAYIEGLPLVESKLRHWNEMLDTNARAPFLLARSLLPGMIHRRRGRIINVIPASRTLAGPFRVSKVALEVVTAVLGTELRGTGVGAVAVNPGFMRTETSGEGREPEIVARAVLKLLHRSPSYANGQVFDVRGSGRACHLRLRRAGGRFG